MFLNMRDAMLPRATDPTASGTNGDISLDKAELVAIFLEALLYGVEALTFVATVYLLHGAKRTKTLFVKFSSVIMMFLLNTIHMGASLRRILNAFVGTVSDPVPDAAGYLADLAGFLYRFKNIIIIIQFIMLDVLVIYRCYMIWDKRIIVTIVPSFGIIAFLVTGIAAIHAFATDTTDTVFTGMTRTWVSAMLCVTLFTKLVCFSTVLAGTLLPRPSSPWHSIYLRINRHATLYKAVLIGIESGGLAVLGAVVLIPVYLAGRNAQGIMLAGMSPLTGQAFLLIIMAALLGLTPSTSGPSRRRKGGMIPNTRVTIPPISISPVSSPTSRFSTGSLFSKAKSPSSASASPSTPSDSSSDYAARRAKLPFAKTAEPALAYTDARYERGGVRGEPLPFSSAFEREWEHADDIALDISRETSIRETSIRDALAYGSGESFSGTASTRTDVSAGSNPRHAFHLARSADGAVEVLQREHASY